MPVQGSAPPVSVTLGKGAATQKVAIVRNLGRSVEMAGGVAPDHRVIEGPPDAVVEGDTVHVAGKHARRHRRLGCKAAATRVKNSE